MFEEHDEMMEQVLRLALAAALAEEEVSLLLFRSPVPVRVSRQDPGPPPAVAPPELPIQENKKNIKKRLLIFFQEC